MSHSQLLRSNAASYARLGYSYSMDVLGVSGYSLMCEHQLHCCCILTFSMGPVCNMDSVIASKEHIPSPFP